MTEQLAQKIHDGRMYYRRGYSLIDAAGNVGLHVDVLWKYITEADCKAHDAVWS